MTRTTSLVLGTITLAVSLSACSAGSSGAAPTSENPTPSSPGVIAAPGRVEAASEDLNLGFEIPGRLEAVLVEEGDVVQAGQLLARLDAAVPRAARASAVARLAMAEAERDRIVNGARIEERREADAVRVQAQVALEQAQREVTRRQNLYRDGVIAREEFERAERDVTVAQARADEAAERARLVQADARPDDRARADAAVALARAELAEVDAQLAKTELRAPADGVIVRRYRRTGETLSFERRDTLVVTMADPSRLRVRVDVNETAIAPIALGQSVEVTADAYGDRTFRGTVTRISTALGQTNVTTDAPGERMDTKVLEVMVDLEPGTTLPLGLRVDTFIRVQ